MKKDQYLAGVNAVFIAGGVDQQMQRGKNGMKYPGEFLGSYSAGYDLVHIANIALPFVLQTAAIGYDDGLGKATKREPVLPSQVVPSQAMLDDFAIVYSNAYTVGMLEAAKLNPPVEPKTPPGTTPVDPTIPPDPTVPKTPAASVPSDNTNLYWIGGIGLVAASMMAGYALSKRLGPPPKATRHALANPSKDINPGHVWLQYVGWVKGKPAGELQVGDRMMWNYGYISTVEQIEQVSPKFIAVKERLQDGSLFDRRMKVDRLVAIAPAGASYPSSR